MTNGPGTGAVVERGQGVATKDKKKRLGGETFSKGS